MRLQREPSADGATLGVLFVNGVFECYCLEDVIRPVKIAGKTAIPAGRYQVVVTMSPRFKRRLPLLVDVPNFTGVRIHPGNTAADTEGCLLPGVLRAAARVGESRKAFDRLFAKLDAALARGQRAYITIDNPPAA